MDVTRSLSIHATSCVNARSARFADGGVIAQYQLIYVVSSQPSE